MLAAEFLEAGFEQEGHGLIQSDRALLAIGEARDTPTGDEGRAVRLLGRDQPRRAMADGSDDLARAVEALH